MRQLVQRNKWNSKDQKRGGSFSYSSLRSAMPPQQGDAYYECAVTRVTPPYHDRNPGYKVDLHIDREDGRVVAFGVVHTRADGTTVDRSEQYRGDRINWWPNGSAQWTGWYGNSYMTGTYNAGNITYTEVIRGGGPNGHVNTTIQTACH
jgi:hypothetical protein